MKKIIILCTIITNTLTYTSQSNNVQDAVQKLYDEIIAPYEPILEKQRDLVGNKLSSTWKEEFFTDHERETVRKSSKTRDFLSNFYTLEPQAMGVDYCLKCVDKITNPNAQDLKICHKKWLESKRRHSAFKNTKEIENKLQYNDRPLRDSLYKGEKILKTKIREIIKKQRTQEQQEK